MELSDGNVIMYAELTRTFDAFSDRIAEEAAQAHAIAPITSLSVEQAAAGQSEALGKAAANAIATITSLPPGASFYLTPRVEHMSTETSRTTSASADGRSGDESATTSSDKVLGNQRGPSEAV